MPKHLNKGYETARTNKASDEQTTPNYAVRPIIKYLPAGATVWCPFDKDCSSYVKLLKTAGFKVIASHIDNGQNFFTYEPEEEYDIIVSNPPFSIKDAVLQRLGELKKPYAVLLPLPSLQGQKRFKDLIGSQALIFDKRINFYQDEAQTTMAKDVAFASIYVCKNVLPADLIFEELEVE